MFNKRPLAIALSATLFAAVAIAETSSEYYENALQFHHKGESKAAVIELKNALQQDYNNISARILLGQIYLTNGEAAAAEKEFTLALASGVDESLIQLDYGRALYSLSKYKQLLKVIKVTNNDYLVDADIHVLRANAYVQLNKLFEAKTEYNSALKLMRNYLPAELGLIGLHISADEIDIAETKLHSILEKEESAEAWYLLAEIAKLKEEYKVAAIRYKKALALNPEALTARHALLDLSLQLADNFEAELQVIELEKQWPDDPLTQYYRALVLLNQGQIKESHIILAKLSNILSGLESHLTEDNYQLNMITAVSYYLLSQPEKARSYINPLLLRNPNNVDLAIMLADIEVNDGNYYLAQNLLEKWRGKKIRNIKFYLLLGTAYAQQKRFFDAEAVLKAGREIFGDSIQLDKLAAASLAYQGKTEQALQILKKVAKGGMQSAQLMLGYMLLEQGLNQEALNAAEKVVDKIDPSITELNFYAACLLKNNQSDKAEKIFAQIVEKDKKFTPALINQARVAIERNELALAKRNLKTATDYNPAELTAVNMYVTLLTAEGQYQQANTVLTNALTLVQDKKLIFKSLINLNIVAKDYELVAKYTNELNSIEPLSSFVLEARIKLGIANKDFSSAKHAAGALFGLSLNNADKMRLISSYQLNIKDYEGVKRSLDRLKVLEPDNISNYILEADYLYYTQGLKQAMVFLESVRLQIPALIWLDANKKIYLRERDYASALKIVDAQLNIRVYDRFVKERISLLQKIERPDEALEFTDLILNANPEYKVYQAMQTDLLIMSNNSAKAIEAIQAAMVDSPNDPKLLNNLASLIAEDKPQQALEYIKQAHKILPEQVQILDTYGWVLINLNRYDEALNLLRKAYLKAPRQAEVNYHLALALFHLNRVTEARASLVKAKAFAQSDAIKAKIKQLKLKL